VSRFACLLASCAKGTDRARGAQGSSVSLKHHFANFQKLSERMAPLCHDPLRVLHSRRPTTPFALMNADPRAPAGSPSAPHVRSAASLSPPLHLPIISPQHLGSQRLSNSIHLHRHSPFPSATHRTPTRSSLCPQGLSSDDDPRTERRYYGAYAMTAFPRESCVLPTGTVLSSRGPGFKVQVYDRFLL